MTIEIVLCKRNSSGNKVDGKVTMGGQNLISHLAEHAKRHLNGKPSQFKKTVE